MENLNHNLSLTPSSLQDTLKTVTNAKKILIAYSGGLDSHVLLHLLSSLPEFDVRALHVHHGLLKEADSWVVHCKSTCSHLNIPLQIEHLNLKINKGESLEDVARVARYKVLKASLKPAEVLVTAHHQNDQTETFLLQLFRGAGVSGLAAMPINRPLENGGFHLRPLLHQSRQTLEAYANKHKLQFIEDPSNADTSFDRNYLRNNILPSLRSRWLGLDKTVGRSAAIQAETKHLLEEFAAQDLLLVTSNKLEIINLEKLATLSIARQKLVIRYWIKRCGFSSPSEKKLSHVFTDVISATVDAQPLLEWSGTQLRRYQAELYIMKPLPEHDCSQVIRWDIKKPLIIDALNIKLSFQELDINDNGEVFTVRFRQGGEKLFIPERGANIRLKNLLAESNVLPWMRSRLPLLYRGNKLLKVIGLNKLHKNG